MAKKDEPTSVPARVLTDCPLGKPNDVVQVDPAIVEAYERIGYIDTDADAVAYAAKLPQNQP